MTDLGEDGERAVSLLRSAAQELLPVVIDMGPEQAKYATFVSLVTEGPQICAVLDPIAAEALPRRIAQPFRIIAAGGVPAWSIAATALWPDGQARARVDLSRARIVPAESSDSSDGMQATELIVLVVRGGQSGAENVFPVQRLGPHLCEIRCHEPLEPGEQLECVELVGERRVLRRSAAQVVGVVPWYTAEGCRSFSCTLALHPTKLANAEPHDLVTDALQVRRVLRLASAIRVRGSCQLAGANSAGVQLIELQADQARFRFDAGSSWPAGTSGPIRIGFELFAVSYELDVRLLECRAGELLTSLPLILRRRRKHRRDQRVAVGEQHRVELSFRNPVCNALERHRVTELSYFSVRFELEPRTALLWEGLPLEQAQLEWDGCSIALEELEVESCAFEAARGSGSAVVSIRDSRLIEQREMIRLLAALAHPLVRAHDGADFSTLHQVYLKAGLFGTHMHRNLDPIVEQTKLVWRKAHRDADDVVRTFVHGPADAPDAAITLLRGWEHGWVAQHFVDTSPDLLGATGRLQAALLDYLVPRPDGRYMLFFVKTDNRIMNSYLRRFAGTSGTPDALARSLMEFWSCKASPNTPSRVESELRVRPARPEDEPLIARAAQRGFGDRAAAALSMVPGEFSLPDTRARFGQGGLCRERGCELLERGDDPVYALLEERSTPGLNLTWMLNACWIVPIHPGRDPDGAALDLALQTILERPAQTNTGERFLNLPPGLPAEQLERWGFSKVASVFLYVLPRAGLHRLFHYALNRHGELDALSVRRERRRNKDGAPG